MTTPSRLSPARIEDAMGRIPAVFVNSPQACFPALDKALGCRLTVKIETLNPIRSFKGRGAGYFVATRTDKTPLVAATAGNFGQGLAYAARAAGIRCIIFAAENASPVKVDAMKGFGAEMHLAGSDFDAAKQAAREFAAEHGFPFVEDGREEAISEGAGTIGLELARDAHEPFDALVIPVGNAALLNGIATWFKTHSPATQIIGVCAEGAPAMERSWRQHRLVATDSVDTIADGIAVREPVAEALDDMAPLADDMMLVGDDDIIAAMRRLALTAGLIVEPAGAAGIAAIAAAPERFAGRRVASIACGSNITAQQLARWYVSP